MLGCAGVVVSEFLWHVPIGRGERIGRLVGVSGGKVRKGMKTDSLECWRKEKGIIYYGWLW